MINGFFLFQFKSLFSLGKFLISLKFDFLKSTSWKSEIKLKIQLSSLNHVTAKKNNNNLKRNQKRTKDIFSLSKILFNKLMIRIYFDTPTFDRITKDQAAKFVDILSTIGGTMGLLTGFSIISGIEIIFFAVKMIFALMKKYK